MQARKQSSFRSKERELVAKQQAPFLYLHAHSRGLPRTFDENTACVREEELDEEVVQELFEKLWKSV